MFFLPLVVNLLAGLNHGESTRALSPAQYRGVQIWNQSYTSATRGSQPDLVRFTYQAQFKNETMIELASITVKLIVDVGGRRVFEGRPQNLSRFVNLSAPIRGSVEPRNKTDYVQGIVYEFPSRYWRSDMVAQLVVTGATTFVNPNLHDSKHMFARIMAANSSSEILRLFQSDLSLLKVHDSRGLNMTLIAFATGWPKVASYVLAHGGNADSVLPSGATIMHMAALSPDPGVCALALQHGGKPNAMTKEGGTPLMYAILFGCFPSWRWLLTHGAKPSPETRPGFTAAGLAIREGQTEALADLVRAGANPRYKDRLGNGWMHYAINQHNLMSTITGYGVPVDDRNTRNGRTPLMDAAQRGSEESTAWLLQHGANPTLRDRAGLNAYDYSKQANTLHTDRFFRRLVSQYSTHR